MDKNKKKMKFLRQEMSNNCIDLKLFLITCCGIYNKDLFSSKIRHKDVKILLPNLRRVSFDNLISNISSLYNGDVVAVRDSYGEILPYINPRIIYDDFEYIDILSFNNNPKSELVKKRDTIKDNLSVEELIILCRKLKRYKKIQEFRTANRVLKNKIYNEEYCKIKQYKREKFNLVMKGREENDKY